MHKPADSAYVAPFDGSFRYKNARTAPLEKLDKKAYKKELHAIIAELDELQHMLYAQDRCAVLFVFQAMDAAGKDSTIRAVMTGINPAGCQVYSFKQPSTEELDHDFLWRTGMRLPERGRIGIFNRSYYEEVLIVRVHPAILEGQRLPVDASNNVWEQRYESIREHEKHLAYNGTVIVKFWLHVSKEQQRKRFMDRLENPEKHWKFSARDVAERAYWDEYMHAYEAAINATSRAWAPWYVIPADHKPTMRIEVARVMADTLKNLNLRYPQASPEQLEQIAAMKMTLENEV